MISIRQKATQHVLRGAIRTVLRVILTKMIMIKLYVWLDFLFIYYYFVVMKTLIVILAGFRKLNNIFTIFNLIFVSLEVRFR